ncbi:phosphoribosyltransferase [Aurantimonas endophytica]|uniref:Putative phosphoribosyltransferase n=1 Tax=Aurantimonas endophytica TaxID=1522175 RepID=A0A7W6HFZ3_9HYPH|nr:phosphoribosyltransferase family protein [Aurantimonas endophytica]MBB4004525.1 putative phosphoribosyltransferase [Aurantimonas endophytica]MCO6405361.1 phosphoribosyltransferase [Aurantimonas endophytica]
MMFRDRVDAGRRLAAELAGYKGEDVVVLALPRGGVPVAAEIATALDAPLDLVLVRKIGVPDQPELAMGAVVDGEVPLVVRIPQIIRAADVDEATFERVLAAELAEIARRRLIYLGDRPRARLAGRMVIVVDDGLATGATARAALHAVRQQNPKRLVLAIPVAAADSLADLAEEADAVVCPEPQQRLDAIGYYYDDFTQTSDEAVQAILARFPAERARESRGDAAGS